MQRPLQILTHDSDRRFPLCNRPSLHLARYRGEITDRPPHPNKILTDPLNIHATLQYVTWWHLRNVIIPVLCFRNARERPGRHARPRLYVITEPEAHLCSCY